MNIYNQLQQLIQPLRLLGIDNFFYLRIRIIENDFIVLSNNQSIAQYLLKHNLSDSLINAINSCQWSKMSVNILSEPNDILYKHLKTLGINDVVSFILPQQEIIEVFNFGLTTQGQASQQFCVRNLGLLKRFIEYFKINIHKTIKLQQTKNTIKVNSAINLSTTIATDDKIVQLYKQIHLVDHNQQIVLTDKERLYLNYWWDGYSLSNIAKRCNIPLTQVKTAINKLKAKTGLKTKSQLLAAFTLTK